MQSQSEPEFRSFTLRLPEALIVDLEIMAAEMTRTRSQQIEAMLKAGVAEYKKHSKKGEAA